MKQKRNGLNFVEPDHESMIICAYIISFIQIKRDVYMVEMQSLSAGMKNSGAVEICQRLGEISGGKILDVATSQGGCINTMMDALKDHDSFIGIDI